MKKDALAQIAQERPAGWRVSLLKDRQVYRVR